MNMQTKYGITETAFYKLQCGTMYGRPIVSIGLCMVDTQAHHPYYGTEAMVTIEFTSREINESDDWYNRSDMHAKLYPNTYPLDCNAIKIDKDSRWRAWYMGDIKISTGYGGTNIEDAAKLLAKIVATINKVSEKYNLAYKYGEDTLALWLDALGKAGIIRIEKNYSGEWHPIEEPKRKAA